MIFCCFFEFYKTNLRRKWASKIRFCKGNCYCFCWTVLLPRLLGVIPQLFDSCGLFQALFWSFHWGIHFVLNQTLEKASSEFLKRYNLSLWFPIVLIELAGWSTFLFLNHDCCLISSLSVLIFFLACIYECRFIYLYYVVVGRFFLTLSIWMVLVKFCLFTEVRLSDQIYFVA